MNKKALSLHMVAWSLKEDRLGERQRWLCHLEAFPFPFVSHFQSSLGRGGGEGRHTHVQKKYNPRQAGDQVPKTAKMGRAGGGGRSYYLIPVFPEDTNCLDERSEIQVLLEHME